jgi:hypothetical protein
MLKDLALTPPVIGRISIGRVVEKNGKRLPEKDDQFTLTTQVQNRDGWMLHPYDERFRQLNEGGKLRSIPVRLLFNDPDLNLRAQYTLFDREDGRPFCAGNGEICRRVTDKGIETLPCPSPDSCPFGMKACKPYGRLHVLIGEDDALGDVHLSYHVVQLDPYPGGTDALLPGGIWGIVGRPAAGVEAARQVDHTEPSLGHLLRRSGGAERHESGGSHYSGA